MVQWYNNHVCGEVAQILYNVHPYIRSCTIVHKVHIFIFDHQNQMCTSFRVIFNLGPVRLLYNYLLMKFLPKSLLNAFALLVKIIFFSKVSMFFRPGIHHTFDSLHLIFVDKCERLFHIYFKMFKNVDFYIFYL